MKNWLFHPLRLVDVGLVAFIVGLAIHTRFDFSWQPTLLLLPLLIGAVLIRLFAASDLKGQIRYGRRAFQPPEGDC